ncbi:hypothetical protein C8J55DRAFT_515890 [Lentinula edodes]|uniref:Leucine rich repeat domain protein n=1 Tax=Lentinula lateritia TaxID=40482 RepID=A0A9W9A9F5_9AGAR|nr:hypothetical protein C8J55DRAFT_515890 [Lentinula edodes]
MQNEHGDDYIRRIAAFIRGNERNLAELGFVRRRNPRRPAETNGSAFYNPLTWFGSESTGPPPKSVVMSIDTHHLFYLLMRLEALNLPVGTLDVRVDSPSRPLSYINLFPDSDKTETLSLSSFRSTFSAVSALSLGVGWWGRPEPPKVDTELKYIYSSFTKLPALSDVSDIFIGAVLDDQARRAGSASRKRMRRIPYGPERHTSFYSAQLPDTVQEVADEETSSPMNSIPPTTPLELSSRKWASLRFLSLSGNDLTFFPTELTIYLTSITHLDLSSNLLNSVPEGLSALYNLVSLNLCDNMIESVLGIYTQLGSVTSINLSRNRLESICGLERLHALERVDLRHNAIEESSEIGRLAPLPNISNVWIEGNPFTEYEESYRVTCFDFFWKEGKTILLDGSPPGFYEKKNLTAPPPEQAHTSRPVSAAHSPPTIAIGHTHPHSHPHSQSNSPPAEVADGSNHSPTAAPPPALSSTSPQLGPVGAVGVSGKSRKKKVKRIVDLDGDHVSEDSASIKASNHRRTTSNGSYAFKHKPQKVNAPQPVDHPSFGQFISLLATPQNLPPTTSSTGETQQPEASTSTATTRLESSTSPKPSLPPLSRTETGFGSGTLSSRTNRRSRHTRYQTEFALPTEGDSAESSPTLGPIDSNKSAIPPSSPAVPSFRRSRNSQTFSSAKSSARRQRVSASVYEPPTSMDNDSDSFAGQTNTIVDEAEAFRRRIEALKQDMGDGWLKIFSQTQMKTPSPS